MTEANIMVVSVLMVPLLEFASAFAALGLIDSSNLVGCSMGRSAGLPPSDRERESRPLG